MTTAEYLLSKWPYSKKTLSLLGPGLPSRLDGLQHDTVHIPDIVAEIDPEYPDSSRGK